MKKRNYEDLSNLTDEQKIERRKLRQREYDLRHHLRKKAEKEGREPDPKLLVNEGKTPEQVRQRKLDLDKSYRVGKNPEEREQYLRAERERKRNARQIKLSKNDIVEKILEKNPDANMHFVNRYMNLVYADYSNYSIFEKHHILPKSMWPEYLRSVDNKVMLPLRAHFLAHWLLVKIFPKSNPMIFAFYILSNHRGRKVGSRGFELARNLHKQAQANKMADGTHPVYKLMKYQKKLLAEGKHHWQGKTNPVFQKMKDGTHNLIGDRNPVHERIRLGIHNLQGDRNPVYERVAKGIHNFQNQKPWRSYASTENSINTWMYAKEAFDYIKENPSHRSKKLEKYLKSITDLVITRAPTENLIKWFDKGWNPSNDPDWLKWIEEKGN